MSKIRGALALAVLAAALASPAAAQVTTGTLVGTVTLQNGDPAPGVQVTATSPALQGERSTVTAGKGDYIIRGLPPGDYSVKFALEGFKTVTNRVVVPPGGQARSDIKLTPANIQKRSRSEGGGGTWWGTDAGAERVPPKWHRAAEAGTTSKRVDL